MRKCLALFVVCALATVFLPLASHAAKLSEADLAKKKEGVYPTGLPLIAFSSDDGVGYGVRAYLYNNGKRADEYFDSSPYFMRIYAQFYQTTNGISSHELNFDFPYIFGTKYRVKTAFVYSADLNANYFGVGKRDSKKHLRTPAGYPLYTYPYNYTPPAGLMAVNPFFYKHPYYYMNLDERIYGSYADYSQDFLTNTMPYDKGYGKWNKYSRIYPTYYFYIFRDITSNFKFMAGAQIQYVMIKPWDNKTVDGHKQFETKLTYDRENPNKDVPGFSGGWTNYARVGLSYDARDYEPDPKSGYYLDYCFELSTIGLGSMYEYTKHTAQANYYISIFQPLVFAARAAYTTATGNIPFYEMGYFGFSLNRREGLGGNRSLRGYKKNRFIGNTMTLASAELRWSFYEFMVAGQRFELKLVALYDTGNVYNVAGEPFTEPRFGDYKHSYGAGFVIAWNQATIIRVYYGRSTEDTAIDVNFEHNF